MRLYATTTSERASKGQGGKWLSIELQSDKTVLPFCFIEVIEKDENNVYLNITGNGELKMGVKYTIPKEYRGQEVIEKAVKKLEKIIKGKQKKDETCEYHGVLNCSRCNPHSK